MRNKYPLEYQCVCVYPKQSPVNGFKLCVSIEIYLRFFGRIVCHIDDRSISHV